MPRKGRELEILVAILEESLGPHGIHVKSPDRLIDKDTGQKREIDVSLRAKVGSFEVLAIIECRDRKQTNDVRWIEEIASKCKSVSADKVMAVSHKRLTDPALEKAKKLNIEVRVLNEIDPAEIVQWFEPKEGTYFIANVNFLDATIELSNDTAIDARKVGLNIDLPLFVKKDGGDPITFKDIWESIPKPVIYHDVPEDGSHVQCIIKLDYNNSQNAFQCIEDVKCITDQGNIDVRRISIKAELWQDTKKVPYIARRYETPDGSMAELVEFEYKDSEGLPYKLGILNALPNGEKHIYLMPKGHKKPGKIDFEVTVTENTDRYIGKL